MQFNDTTNESGVVQEINDICHSDNNNFPLTSKARRVNHALSRFFTLAFQTDGKWTFDDASASTVPIETIDLASGTQSYEISTFASEILSVLRVELVRNDDVSIDLSRLNRDDIVGSLTEYANINATPNEYDLVGGFIYLYPAPNYNKTDGLCLYFNRNRIEFVAGDTTKTLPVPSLFNNYVCNLASLPYLIEQQKPNKNDIMSLIAQDEVAIKKHFSKREVNIHSVLSPIAIDSM